MPRTYYERDEDWLVTCPECHGEGTIGTGILENDFKMTTGFWENDMKKAVNESK